MKKKFDVRSLLTIGVALAGIIGTALSNKLDEKNMAAMKKELKSELLKELSSSK